MIQQCTGSFNTHTKEEMWAGVAQSIQRLGYRLDNQDLIPGWCREEMFSLCHCIQTGSGTHSTFYSMGIRVPS